MNGRQEANSSDAGRVVAEWVADGAATGLLMRRQHNRYLWAGSVELLIDPGMASERRISGDGQDISEGGMGLVVHEALPIATRVLVRYVEEDVECPWVPAHVVHATPAEGGYRLGVEFELDSTQ